ncbi:hypothetical protein GJ496_009111 [Pomphorhynchus laevis]|nr:hypothetical protein GJ496_009111 [Pomphorhynchus laevis]
MDTEVLPLNNVLYGIVVREYSSGNNQSNMLSLMHGEIVQIRKQENEWLFGKICDKSGWFPSSCIDILWNWKPGDTNVYGSLSPNQENLHKQNTSEFQTQQTNDSIYQSISECTASPIAEPSDDGEDRERNGSFYGELGSMTNSNGHEVLPNPVENNEDLIRFDSSESIHNSNDGMLDEIKKCQEKLMLLNRTQTALLAIDDLEEDTVSIQNVKQRISYLESHLQNLIEMATNCDDSNGDDIKRYIEKSLITYNEFIYDQQSVRQELTKIHSIQMESHVVEEILRSEGQYSKCLNLVMERVAQRNMHFLSEDEYRCIFTTLESVSRFSSKFCYYVQIESMSIGEFLHQNWNEFSDVYSEYVFKYDKLTVVFGKLASDVRSELEISYEQIKHETKFKNLELLFTYPIQRLMQYPILLNRLCKLQCSDDSNDDYKIYKEVNELMKDFVQSIDELRARNHIVFKYLTKEERSFFEKLYSFNFKSIDKVTNRAIQKVIVRINGSQLLIDRRFEELELQFKEIKEKIMIFTISVSKYMKSLQSMINRYTDILSLMPFTNLTKSNNLSYAKETDSFEVYINSMKTNIDKTISSPLRMLLYLMKKPQKLIDKRMDKLLDYERNRTRNEQEAKSILSEYVALNEQLCILLTPLCQQIQSGFNQCAYNFYILQSKFTKHFQLHQISCINQFNFCTSSASEEITQSIDCIINIPFSTSLSGLFSTDDQKLLKAQMLSLSNKRQASPKRASLDN